MSASEGERTNARATMRRLSQQRDILQYHLQLIESSKHTAELNFQRVWDGMPATWKRTREGVQFKANAGEENQRYIEELEAVEDELDVIRNELQSLVTVAFG